MTMAAMMMTLMTMIVGVSSTAWPGPNNVTTLDQQHSLSINFSGLKYFSFDVLYAVVNDPSLINRLIWNGKYFVRDSSNGWSSGKTIYFPDGSGSPDAEDLTFDDLGTLYVCTEEDNSDPKTSRLSVLSYLNSSYSSPSTQLIANEEWNLTKDLPTVGANLGLEGITWIPDSYLVSTGFIDPNTKAIYDPSVYPKHGNGVFMVALEGNGNCYLYVLFMDGSHKYQRLTSFNSGESAVMSVEFDPDSGYVWTVCDNTCDGRMHVFTVIDGVFNKIAKYDRPTTLPNYNDEGYTLAPDSECVNGTKRVFWADDDYDNGYAIRGDGVPCGNFI